MSVHCSASALGSARRKSNPTPAPPPPPPPFRPRNAPRQLQQAAAPSTPAADGDGQRLRSAHRLLLRRPLVLDSRFGKEEHYEWCKDFSHFRHLLAPLLSPSLSVLEIGCGNSQLSEELLREGVAGGITCTDLSPVAVERVRDRLADQGIDDEFTDLVYLKEGVEVVVADMLHLPFRRESFDLVIEKGTMEVLFVDSGSPLNPNRTTVDNVMKMLEGIHKALRPEGIFVSITFGQPHLRRRFFEAPGFTWSFECSIFGDEFHYFFYTLQKGKRSLESGGYQHTLPVVPRINMYHEELEDEDYLSRINIDGKSVANYMEKDTSIGQ